MPRQEIADEVGCSLINLKRAFRGTRLNYYNHLRRRPELVRQVCAYYEKHGRPKTERRFPDLKIRSIVERYKYFRPRQTRWKEKELIQAARGAGILSHEELARYFNRPRANEGSIKSLFTKRFGHGGGTINGMSRWQAIHLVYDDCPFIRTNFWHRSKSPKYEASDRYIALWVDMEKHLRAEMPKFIKDAVKSMAQFQRWLFECKNPRLKIMRMIRTGRLVD